MTVLGVLPPISFDVEGPVQAEVFVIWLAGDHLELSGPCGAAPWYIEVGHGEDPMHVVERMARQALGAPRLVHSTSWRGARGGVVLSFTVVVDDVGDFESVPIARTDLARSAATAAPTTIEYAQVLEHGLRHLAWLAQDDAVVANELSSGWRAVLAKYVPEPFKRLEVP
jgi:hypothetical protein